MTEDQIRELVIRFQSYIVNHPIFEQTLSRIKERIYMDTLPKIVLVIGPSRVGKSGLIKVLQKQVYEHYTKKIEDDPGFIPIASIQAQPPLFGGFKWNDYFIRGLEALNEPLISKKILDPNIKNGAKYQRAYQSCLKNRKVKAICIDEAQKISECTNGRRFLNQFDVLKSMLDDTKVSHFLFGVYELSQIVDISAQFVNRLQIIHFPRYKRIPGEFATFASVIASIRKVLPIDSDEFELNYLDYCYSQTVGCVGLINEWFSEALASSLCQGKRKLTIDHLYKHAHPQSSLKVLTEEAEDGERRLEALMIKLNPDQQTTNIQVKGDVKDVKVEGGSKNSFRRSLKRDEVGS